MQFFVAFPLVRHLLGIHCTIETYLLQLLLTYSPCESYTNGSAPQLLWWQKQKYFFGGLFFLDLGNSTSFFETCSYYKHGAVTLDHNFLSFCLYTFFLILMCNKKLLHPLWQPPFTSLLEVKKCKYIIEHFHFPLKKMYWSDLN